MKVLVVDDNIAIQEILKDILMDQGHVVRLSGSIGEAIDEIIDFEPNAILLDSMVNNEDSMTILIHAHERNPELPLDTVLIKSVSEEAPRDSSYIKAVVNKPFKSTDIVAALNVLVSKKEEERVEAEKSKRNSGGFLSKLKKIKRESQPGPGPAPVAEEDIMAEYLAGEGPMYGRSYVFFEKAPARIVNLVNIFNPKDYSILIISSENSKAVMQTYGTDEVEVATLSSASRGRLMDINALGTLTVFIKEFISNHNKPVVIIEDFTDIIDSNGLNHSLVFIHQLVMSAGKQASLAVSVDPSILTAKDRSILLGDMSEYTN